MLSIAGYVRPSVRNKVVVVRRRKSPDHNQVDEHRRTEVKLRIITVTSLEVTCYSRVAINVRVSGDMQDWHFSFWAYVVAPP